MMNKKTQKIGVICSIVQIILSIICLIYSAINQENIIMWVLFLCSGILLHMTGKWCACSAPSVYL